MGEWRCFVPGGFVSGRATRSLSWPSVPTLPSSPPGLGAGSDLPIGLGEPRAGGQALTNAAPLASELTAGVACWLLAAGPQVPDGGFCGGFEWVCLGFTVP